jgi:malate dehydrogenase (oxaloacetate-decarboxylating)
MVPMRPHGYQILNDPFLNRGTAFTAAERARLGLTGLLPSRVQTLAEQVTQAYAMYCMKTTAAEKRLYLMSVFNENRVLFYALFAEHLEEFMPVVYDPAIAQSIEHYSAQYTNPQGAAFLDIEHPEQIGDALAAAADGRDIRLIVVTDSEGILGIGDWGAQGVDIAVGKLMVYTAAAGIDPATVLPVVIDAGTDNQALLDDPGYLGCRHGRIRGDDYLAFADRFVAAAQQAFPGVYLHWEDLGREHAATVLDTYRDRIPTFNDDIQGTGIVVLAALLGALNITGGSLTDQTYVCFGAGSAGAGIVGQVCAEMRHLGLDDQEARSRFFLVDQQGLLFDDTPGLTPKQRPFARSRAEFPDADELTTLAAVIRRVRPTILVGTSTCPGAFTEDVVREMAAHAARPIILPLSNPTKLAEATAADLVRWTEGRALVATGVPRPSVEFRGIDYRIGQANNALVYPGLGLGVIASGARRVSPEMISAAAHSLGNLIDPSEPGAPVLPPVSRLRDFSRTIAEAVVRAAVAQGLAQEPIADVGAAVDALQWTPEYSASFPAQG